jgi:superfamily II DNA or RNA helicase
VTETVKKRLQPRDTVAIGLSATPLTKGLGKLYDAIINVTTTNKLIDQGFLSKYRIFACTEPDMDGVKVVAGEWEQEEAQRRALKVVGDVVQEYLKHGQGRKFICSAVDTAHVEELQRQFLAAGINAATYTYKDKSEDRTETVNEFRKPDSSIRGLITVTAASKGFDVADIGVVIMARPLRKSLAEHIQFFGRGLRIADGKQECLVLDHSGNCARFWKDMQDFFENGVTELDDGKKKEKPKPKPKEMAEAEPVKCPQCRHIHNPMPFCPSCGHQYPKKAAVAHVSGTLKEMIAGNHQRELTASLYPQIAHYVIHSRKREGEEARRMAQAIYINWTGAPAQMKWESVTPVEPTREVRSRLVADQIRRAHGRKSGHSKVAVRPMPARWGESRGSTTE